MTTDDSGPGRPAVALGATDAPWARLDVDRAARTGDPEVVFGSGKTLPQLVEILSTLHRAHPDRAVLATRLEAGTLERLVELVPGVTAHPVAGCATLGPLPEPVGTVAVISAGTSDQRVAAEAELSVRCHGSAVVRIDDVGVSGLHRLLDARPRFAEADALVVVAGMEGALPSVVGGLTSIPLVAVPTSVGYGLSLDGLTALLAMLSSCAAGVVVTNIDNGFGAGVHAARIARRAGAGR